VKLEDLGEGGFIRKIRERHFPVAPVGAQKIVAGAHGQTHEPMFEGRVAAKAAQFLKRLEEDLLDDLFRGRAVERLGGQSENPGGIARVQGSQGLLPPGGELLHQFLVARVRAVGGPAERSDTPASRPPALVSSHGSPP